MKKNRYEVSKKLWGYGNHIRDIETEIINRNISIGQAYNPLKACVIDRMPSGKGIPSDTTANTFFLVERYQNEVLKLIEEKEQTLKDFEDYISCLDYRHKEVLRLRYVNGLSILKISFKVGYAEGYVKQLLSQAQDKLIK